MTGASVASGRLRLAVVGGGLAGVAAALRAADAGADVVLVERRSKLGGLTWSFERKGLVFDNGQHVFLRCCTAYRSFLERIGGASQVHLQPALDVPVLAPGGMTAHIARTSASLPSPLHLGPSLLLYRHLPVADRLRLVRAVVALRRLALGDPALDAETFGAWLARHGQSPVAVERLWDLVTLPTVNVAAADASLALAAKVFRTGLLDTVDGADIGWAAVPLGELHGANATRALESAGVEVLTGASATAVETDGAAVTVVAAGRRLTADAVIVALPHDVAPGLLPPGALGGRDVARLGLSPIVNVHLVFDRRVTDLPFAAAVGSPVQFVFDRTGSSGATGGAQCLVVSLSAADAYIGARPDDLIRTFREALAQLFPRALRAGLVDAVVTREHAATFRGVPGTAALRPGPATAVPGVFVAGAWCDTGWPATMEGAVRSGTAAAVAAIGHADDPAPVLVPRPLEEARA